MKKKSEKNFFTKEDCGFKIKHQRLGAMHGQDTPCYFIGVKIQEDPKCGRTLEVRIAENFQQAEKLVLTD